MSSFINSLGKGFIRSAINQIGRDAGRVVSNNIYGDAHSIPHRNVSGTNTDRVSSIGKIENEGVKAIEPSVGAAVFWGFIGFMFSIIGGIILIIVGYKKIKGKYEVQAWQYESQAIYVADGRYRSGERYDGQQLIRRKVKLPADEYQICKNEKVAKIYLCFGFAACLLYLFYMVFMFQHVPS